MPRALVQLSGAVGLALEVWSLAAFVGGGFFPQMATVEGLAAHLLGVIVGTSYAWFAFPEAYRLRPGRSLPLFFGLALPAPLLGLALLVLLAESLRATPQRDASVDYVIGERDVLTQVEFMPTDLVNTMSVLDILSGDDGELRRTAILALRQVEPRKAIPVLKKAIADSDEQVRLLAQTQYNAIIAGLELSIKSMEADLELKPPHPKRLLELAEFYHELVFLEISSEETELIYLQRAVQLLGRALELDPNLDAALALLMKCKVRGGEGEKGRELINQLRTRGVPEDVLKPWEAELAYLRRDWGELRTVLSQVGDGRGGSERMRAAVEFWMRPQPAQSSPTAFMKQGRTR